MMNLKKLFFVFIIVSLLVFSSVPPVFANTPMPADHLTVVLSNIPDDVMYADLLIKISNDDPNFVDFCNGLEYQDHLTQYESLRNHYRDVKVALLDKDFNIIVVSESIQLPKENNSFVFDGEIYFDFNTNSLDLDTRINPYFILFGGFISILIMLMSIGIETVTSLLFGFRGRQALTILVVNICSQITMRSLYLI